MKFDVLISLMVVESGDSAQDNKTNAGVAILHVILFRTNRQAGHSLHE